MADASSSDSAAISADARVLPPVRRDFRSLSDKFDLTLTSADNWNTPQATAELAEIKGAERRVVWRRTLPHELGPRLAMVTDGGAVILFDEWINVPSRHALMLIDSGSRTLADYSIDQLISALGVPRAGIAANAKLGVWLSGQPTLSGDGATVRLRAGGRDLQLNLADGHLSVAN